MDLGKKPTPAQDTLFALVMNHPEADAAGAVRAPMTQEIADAFVAVVQEEAHKFLPKQPKKKMPHSVEVSVDRA